MNSGFQIRIRSAAGQQVISGLFESSSCKLLKAEIEKLTKIPASNQILKTGYPPVPIASSDSLSLKELNISAGDTIIVEEDLTKKTPISNSSANNAHTQKRDFPSSQIPDKDGLIMIRRIIPSDNSCLFNSIAYALDEQNNTNAHELRSIVASFIMSDPETYNEAVLERPNKAYCEWILRETSWGGDVELGILADYYNVEIVAIDVITGLPHLYGSKYDKRIFVIYDGIHYDVIVRNISEEMEKTSDIKLFSKSDNYALDGALFIAHDLKTKRQFVDVNKFSIMCGVCSQGLTGQKEVMEHSKQTGHSNFSEIKK